MNKILENFARTWLKENLAKCTEGQQHVFKRMYGPFATLQNIDNVVDGIDTKQLDWAMTQVSNTLK